jgi:protein-S-isoprenylcysteine O-methyltransferase Ste14
VAICALVYKLRIEERWMLRQFGEAYRDYQRVSWALLPFIY